MDLKTKKDTVKWFFIERGHPSESAAAAAENVLKNLLHQGKPIMGDDNGVSFHNIRIYAAEITEELKVVLN